MISAISSQGSVRFMVYQDAMNQQRLIRFMERLMRTSEQKVFLILDNLKVHHGKFAAAWLEKNKEKMEVFFLPPYAPEYNPDEYLNHALKISVHSGQLPYTSFPTKSSHLYTDYSIIPLLFPVSSSIRLFPIFARRSNTSRYRKAGLMVQKKPALLPRRHKSSPCGLQPSQPLEPLTSLLSRALPSFPGKSPAAERAYSPYRRNPGSGSCASAGRPPPARCGSPDGPSR